MCAEGFGKKIKERSAAVRRGLLLCARLLRTEGICSRVRRSKLWFCSKLNKTQFVDVAPTLGVNHVISGVVVSCVASISVVFYALITVYI